MSSIDNNTSTISYSGACITGETSTTFTVLRSNGTTDTWVGTGFTYNFLGVPTGGTVTSFKSGTYELRFNTQSPPLTAVYSLFSVGKFSTLLTGDETDNINEVPTITSGATASVAENAQTTTVVYTAIATDPDKGDTITYSLTGTDAVKFNIDPTVGTVTLKGSADFETQSSYSIEVIATDRGGLEDPQDVTITVADKNEEPTITSGATASTPAHKFLHTDPALEPQQWVAKLVMGKGWDLVHPQRNPQHRVVTDPNFSLP